MSLCCSLTFHFVTAPYLSKSWPGEEAVRSVYLHWEDVTWPTFPSPEGLSVVWSLCNLEKKDCTSCLWLESGCEELRGASQAASLLLDWHPVASLSPYNVLGAFPGTHGALPARSLLCLWVTRQEKEEQLQSTVEILTPSQSGSERQRCNMERRKEKICIYPGSRIGCFPFTPTCKQATAIILGLIHCRSLSAI